MFSVCSADTKYAILGIGVIGITVLCIVIYNFFRTRKITDFFENNPADIENITIMSGNNGNMVYVLYEDYNTVTEILSELSFPGINNGEPRDGWDYRISIDFKSGESFCITFQGDRCTINGEEYNLIGYDRTTVENLFLKYYEE